MSEKTEDDLIISISAFKNIVRLAKFTDSAFLLSLSTVKMVDVVESLVVNNNKRAITDMWQCSRAYLKALYEVLSEKYDKESKLADSIDEKDHKKVCAIYLDALTEISKDTDFEALFKNFELTGAN